MKNILVVGSWAKEQITIEKIKEKQDVRVFSYLDVKNPGILSKVDGCKLGSLYEVNDIVDYACEINADLIIVTTASPLCGGVVDILKEAKISVFGPVQLAAKLESDKAFARELMCKYQIDALPEFNIFSKSVPAIEYAKKLGWKVAVKPAGLTEGLGVKVFGDQLRDSDEVNQYIDFLLKNMVGGNKKVIIEEKLEGEEFALQCLVNDELIVPVPAVQDFKKLLAQDKGPNTASMGSYSDKGYLLPFMRQQDYECALEIIRKTIVAFKRETGKVCFGFLYGQFMITNRGLKLIEYNFRPGDPEWMNTLMLLKNNILDVVVDLLNDKVQQLDFENQACVCKYIVPKQYPYKMNEILEVSFDAAQLRKNGVNVYYSCGFDSQNKLNVGYERGIALSAKADTVWQASEKIESAIPLINGDFHYRPDIGSKQLISAKVRNIKS